jgi:vacuolar-type H+-ATPase subunit F/Vma7
MGDVAAIGAEALIRGYRLAGLRLFPAETDDEVRLAWSHLESSVDLVILTAAAERALAEAVVNGPLVAVLP